MVSINNMSIVSKTIVLFISMFVLSACSNVSVDEQLVSDSPTNPNVSQRLPDIEQDEVNPGNINFKPLRIENTEVVALPSGSLFRADKAIGLYQPSNKYELGDMILVKLDEKMAAKKQLKYKSNSSDSFLLNPVTLNAGSIHIGGDNLNGKYDQEKDLDSSAESKQSNSLIGEINVFVREITANGNLIVAGEKWIKLNQGKEYVRFSGEIRTDDIRKDNTISSIKVGNTQIEFTGKGSLQDNQKPVFLSKLFGLLD
ncbi:MAG: flagellar basal body L-ring protein FlgH [Colwellia sp.]